MHEEWLLMVTKGVPLGRFKTVLRNNPKFLD